MQEKQKEQGTGLMQQRRYLHEPRPPSQQQGQPNSPTRSSTEHVYVCRGPEEVQLTAAEGEGKGEGLCLRDSSPVLSFVYDQQLIAGARKLG